MSERDELIDQLRYRPVATTAAQMRKAADLLERDGALIAELEARLRDTAEALQAFVDSRRGSGWVISAGDDAGPALNKALPNAREILAKLKEEGWI